MGVGQTVTEEKRGEKENDGGGQDDNGPNVTEMQDKGSIGEDKKDKNKREMGKKDGGHTGGGQADGLRTRSMKSSAEEVKEKAKDEKWGEWREKEKNAGGVMGHERVEVGSDADKEKEEKEKAEQKDGGGG